MHLPFEAPANSPTTRTRSLIQMSLISIPAPSLRNVNAMKILGLLPFVVLLASPALALVFDRRADPQPTLSPQYAKRYLYDCDDSEKMIEASAWRDHLAIAKEALNWKPGKKWQPAFDMYMGTDSKDKPYSDAIKSMLLYLLILVMSLLSPLSNVS